PGRTRAGAARAGACRSPGAAQPGPRHPRRPRSLPCRSWLLLLRPRRPRRFWITPLHGNPHRVEYEEAHPAEEDLQALGDRPGPAEREAARVGLDPGLRDVGDDVALG